MNKVNRISRFTKRIARIVNLIVVFAILAATFTIVQLETVSAHSDRSMSQDDAMASQASNPTVTQIAGGEGHSCALTPQGGVVCWGANWSGQLGNGTTTDSAVPVQANVLHSGVMDIALGGYRTCALTTHGRVYCWGNPTPGTSSSSTPVEFNGLGSQVIQLAVGPNHTCALTSSGSVLCWGFNSYGSLGNGTYTDSSTPVTAIASGAVQVAINQSYTSCAVMASGGVKCWGLGDRGQLGDGIISLNHKSSVPVDVLKTVGNPLTGATKVVLGVVFTCAQVGGGVYCWGVNRFGQLGIGTTDLNTHPYASPVLTALGGPALSGVDQLMAGDEHACVHRTNGNMQCWGHNVFGQLGNGVAINPPDEIVSTTPVTVLNAAGSAPLTGVTQMADGSGHTCVFTSWEEASPFLCWGYNAFGQLGNGSTYEGKSLPTPVSDISNFSPSLGMEGESIVAGGEHTCSISAGGGVSCWGNNAYGQLGNGSTSDSLVPVNVAGLSSEAKSLALGKDHTCAILSSGQLLCWGRNHHGQLGNGTTDDSLVPTYVTLPDVAVTTVAVGDNHSCALAEDGSVLCWGENSNGQLGDGTTEEKTSPVTAIASGVSGIALGGSTSCAVLTAGGVKCWGLGDLGQLGDGNSGTGYYQSTPTDTLTGASTPLDDVSQITMGLNFACALKDDRVYCWGKNSLGQLGIGATSPFEVYAGPVLSSVGGSPLEGANQITAGGAHACAHQYTDRVKCWGSNTNRQLGDGTSSSYQVIPRPVLDPEQMSQASIHSKIPSEIIIYLERAAQVSAEGNHTCAFFGWDSPNPYRCWGGNTHGQLGDGTTQDSALPGNVGDYLNFGSPPVHKVVAGATHSCGMTAAGGVKCWGSNGVGQLGDGSNTRRLTPVQVSGLESGVVSLAGGHSHTCALTTFGGVKCWGDNSNGQLGDGSNNNRNKPVDVSGLPSGVISLAAGGLHTCALTTAGGVKCWGDNIFGQLGDGSGNDSNVPVNVSGLSSGVTAITAGVGFHTCALTTAGGVKCWGANIYGQLGDNTKINRSAPVQVTGLTGGITALTAGYYHTCALTSSGGVKCWGDNEYGQLGDGSTNEHKVPFDVTGLANGITALANGSYHTCALNSSTGVKCWGRNHHGQLGDGSTNDHNAPVDVIGLPSGVTSIVAGVNHNCAILSGSDPLRCWGDNTYGQFGDGTTTSNLTPVISNWLTASGLLEDQKPAVFLLPRTESAIVVPAQTIPLRIIVHVTIVEQPPSPPLGRVTLNDAAFIYDEKIPLHPYFLYNIPESSNGNVAYQSMRSFDEGTINLYYYEDGEWIPVLPCTGCSLDLANHRLIANLDKEGIYAVMEGTISNVFLPYVRK